jgi:hypothetical protein
VLIPFKASFVDVYFFSLGFLSISSFYYIYKFFPIFFSFLFSLFLLISFSLSFLVVGYWDLASLISCAFARLVMSSTHFPASSTTLRLHRRHQDLVEVCTSC